jgi:hypothetical protein
VARIQTKNKVGGRNSCSICNHPDREDIDAGLIAMIPHSKLSKRYGLSHAALSNHRNRHMSKTEFVGLRRARAGVNRNSSETALTRIENGLDALEDVMKTAQTDKNAQIWLAGYKERLRTLEIIGKAKGEFSDAPQVTVNLWQSVEWQTIRAVVFEVLNEYPELRAALAKRLIAIEQPALPAKSA